MDLIYGAIVTGILSGGVYALMASGLTLVFGVMDIINVGQGALVILGAYLTYTLGQHFHIDPFVSLVLTIPAMFVIGAVIEITIIKRLKRERTMLSILVMFAVALIIEGVLTITFSADLVKISASYVDSSFQVGSVYIAYVYLYGLRYERGVAGGPVRLPLPHEVWPGNPRHGSEPHRRRTHRH